ncbi:dihydroneopterin aldolase [Desulfuribacillus stibiiarsenatis]|uniref:7,8-dihydroneopterin aldolase n=1 Tax=Desulfuribacillus stibiiarsenatis TaxID=1390249 RepID=A0A1E5L2M8_9FIRM|nr:dihydroneopterin aldolase [Desulfuribacillus stibiiarsenatis]OEH84376.1 dihydroneopterin aldolase [Desulfuribacillus stibiiarsenatis]
MDKILMKGMQFYGYHGVLQEEQILGQPFIIDIELYLPLSGAGINDSIDQTVHYGMVYEDVKAIVETRRFDLIEALAETIATEVLLNYPIVEEIKVQIQKPQAPVKGIFSYMGVEITRKR